MKTRNSQRRVAACIFMFAWGAIANGEEPSLFFPQAAARAVAACEDLSARIRLLALRRETLNLAFRAYLPELTFAFGRSDRVSMSRPDSFSKSVGVSVRQTVWDGGTMIPARALERAEIVNEEAELARYSRRVAESAVDAYRAVLVARKKETIRESALERLRAEYLIMETEARIGRTRVDELEEAAVELQSADVAVSQARLEVQESEAVLARMIGLDPLPVLGESLTMECREIELDERYILDLACSRNPELTAARFAFEKLHAEHDTRSLEWIPTISLTGDFRVRGEEYPLTDYSWNIGLQLDFTGPWLAGSVRASAGQEGAYERGAEASLQFEPFPDPAASVDRLRAASMLELEWRKYESSRRSLNESVRASVASYHLSSRKFDLARDALAVAERKLRLARAQAELGTVRRVDLLERELAAERAAIAVVEAVATFEKNERSIEALLDLPPGGLKEFPLAARAKKLEDHDEETH